MKKPLKIFVCIFVYIVSVYFALEFGIDCGRPSETERLNYNFLIREAVYADAAREYYKASRVWMDSAMSKCPQLQWEIDEDTYELYGKAWEKLEIIEYPNKDYEESRLKYEEIIQPYCMKYGSI